MEHWLLTCLSFIPKFLYGGVCMIVHLLCFYIQHKQGFNALFRQGKENTLLGLGRVAGAPQPTPHATSLLVFREHVLPLSLHSLQHRPCQATDPYFCAGRWAPVPAGWRQARGRQPELLWPWYGWAEGWVGCCSGGVSPSSTPPGSQPGARRRPPAGSRPRWCQIIPAH